MPFTIIRARRTRGRGRLAPVPLRRRLRQAATRVALALLAPPFAPARRAPTGGWPAPRRILVLKPCCTGDLVFATPLIAALKTAYPGGHLAVATSAWCAPVVANNPHVDAVLDVPATIGPRKLAGLARRLRAERFDLALVPDRSPLLGVLVWLARVPRRAGLDSEGRGFPYTDRVPARPDDYTRHEAALYGAVGAAVGAPLPPGQRTEYHTSLVARAAARATVAERGWRSPLWVLHPGGGVNPGGVFTPKRWPAERFAALADGLLRDRGGTVLLLGDATDADATAAVCAAMRGPAENLAGQFDFARSLALAHLAALYVGNDTGMTHAAHAGGTPTVAIFGPTSAARYGLWGGAGTTATMAVGRVPWSPCWRDGALRCTCGSAWCMDAVSVEAVRAAADRTLAAAGATWQEIARGLA